MKIKNTKLLFLYKTIFFKYVKFETNDKNLKIIVETLNIKNRKNRIEYIYNEAINEINKYYWMDLCQFKDDKCVVQRNNNSKTKDGCCRTCPHLGKKGCTSTNLPCKLLYCKTALQNLKLLKIKNIKILKCLSITQRLILKTDYYSTKEEIINDLYYGILLYGFRSLNREIKRYIKVFKIKKSK